MNNTCPGETAQSRTVAKLKHRLRSGQFTNVMPGERELSKALAAGRGTIRKALAQLQEEGFLAAPDKNRARKIIRTSTSPVQSLPLLEKRVCFLSSVPIRDIPQSIWVELYQLEKALREEGIALQLVEAAWEEKKILARGWKNWKQNIQAAAGYSTAPRKKYSCGLSGKASPAWSGEFPTLPPICRIWIRIGKCWPARGRLPVPERAPSDRALHPGFQAERQ